MAEDKQESQKTVTSFVVGLLIGGLLVWSFSGPAPKADEKNETNGKKAESGVETKKEAKVDVAVSESKEASNTTVTEVVKATLPVGDGKIEVTNQAAGDKVVMKSATYPIPEGWVGVRDYQNDQLAGLLGVVRFSAEQGLVPSEIVLQRNTLPGNEYAIVVYSDNGDKIFNLVEDKQVDGIFSTFSAE